ncbi:MAG: hypothetical protein ABSA23_13020 [Anaerolineales bacterium]|jgi:hypothetical protein
MKIKGYFVLAGVIVLLLASSGCSFPTPGLPTCPTAGLQAPVLTGPAMWSVVASLSPSLTWTYPDASCNPQGYAIDLRTGPLFTDHLGGGTGNPSTSWGPGSPLQPGREYEWGVQAINGTTLGPPAGYNYFFTGPMCDTNALAAPSLLQPANGAIINELDPSLIWQYPDACLPQGYRVDLSTDPTFADTSLSGGTGTPSTRWGPGNPLANCTVYYWKITPMNDTTLGPVSSVFSFTTQAPGICPKPVPVNQNPITVLGPPILEIPTPTPTMTLSPTPTQAGFIFIPNLNANCRSGPNPVFSILDVALKGHSYLMDGRNLDGSWFRIMLTPNEGCWVPSTAGTPPADLTGLRVLIEPPTPTAVPPTATLAACSRITNPKICSAQPNCQWKLGVTGGGACTSK